MLTISHCHRDEFTCSNGKCVNIDQRCDGITQCVDGSDEQNCRLVVPSIGYNKFLVPPPLEMNQQLRINISYDFKMILYIDEEENFMRVNFNLQKEWYNSFLTFQNLKQHSDNLIFSDDRDMIWIPWITTINLENKGKCKQTEEIEKLKIARDEYQSFQYNSLSINENAFLFKARKIYQIIIYLKSVSSF